MKLVELLPLRVRRIERVRLHADLTMLARLAVALDKARAVTSEEPSHAAARYPTGSAFRWPHRRTL